MKHTKDVSSSCTSCLPSLLAVVQHFILFEFERLRTPSSRRSSCPINSLLPRLFRISWILWSVRLAIHSSFVHWYCVALVTRNSGCKHSFARSIRCFTRSTSWWNFRDLLPSVVVTCKRYWLSQLRVLIEKARQNLHVPVRSVNLSQEYLREGWKETLWYSETIIISNGIIAIKHVEAHEKAPLLSKMFEPEFFLSVVQFSLFPFCTIGAFSRLNCAVALDALRTHVVSHGWLLSCNVPSVGLTLSVGPQMWGVFMKSTEATPCEHFSKWKLTPKKPPCGHHVHGRRGHGSPVKNRWRLKFVKNMKLRASLKKSGSCRKMGLKSSN